MLDRFHLSFVTAQQGVPGDVVPWPEREVPRFLPLFSLPPQAAQERHLRSYYHFLKHGERL